jgi:hypothetical protein
MGAALSLSSLVTGGYALVSLRDVLDVPMRALAAEIWPPALAALASAGTLLLLDRTVVRSAAHAAPLGLALVLGEIVGTLLLYGTLLARLRPRRLAELKALGGIVVARVRAPNLPAG